MNYTYCEAYGNETQWGILLGTSVKDVKIPHGQHDRNPSDTPVNGSPLQTVHCETAATAGILAARCLVFSSDPNLQPFSAFLQVPTSMDVAR